MSSHHPTLSRETDYRRLLDGLSRSSDEESPPGPADQPMGLGAPKTSASSLTCATATDGESDSATCRDLGAERTVLLHSSVASDNGVVRSCLHGDEYRARCKSSLGVPGNTVVPEGGDVEDGSTSQSDVEELFDGESDHEEAFHGHADDVEVLDTDNVMAPQSGIRPYTRCTVETVLADINGKEKHVHVFDRKGEHAVVILRDCWISSQVDPGDIINIIGTFLEAPSALSNTHPAIVLSAHDENMLVQHPDILLAPSVISMALSCPRKARLTSFLRPSPGGRSNLTARALGEQGQGGSKASRLGGIIWHKVFGRLFMAASSAQRLDDLSILKEGPWTADIVARVTEKVVYSPEGVEGCFEADIEEPEVLRDLNTTDSGLEGFSQRYIAGAQEPNSSVKGINPLGVEDEIWSPMYGMRGFIDFTVSVTLSVPTDEHNGALLPGGQARVIMPFEIKTGSPDKFGGHRAQVILYTLLLEERCGVRAPGGLLYYKGRSEPTLVWANAQDVKALMMRRNELADSHMRHKASLGTSFPDMEDALLPPVLDNEHVCKTCHRVEACMVYRKAVDRQQEPLVETQVIFDRETSHLTEEHAIFFQNWDRILSLEHEKVDSVPSELWTMTAKSREKRGRCFSGMVLDRLEPTLDDDAGVASLHLARFTKAPGQEATLPQAQICAGDPVIISGDPGILALVRGVVKSVSCDAISVTLERPPNALSQAHLAWPRLHGTRFRIDRDGISRTLAILRRNLVELFTASGGGPKSRSRIVDLDRPTFSSDITKGQRRHGQLDENQSMVLHQVLSANDYVLVSGFPGSGKTRLVAEITQALVDNGKKVLLAAYTHKAVDAMVLALLRYTTLGNGSNGILRLGNKSKMRADVRKFAPQDIREGTTKTVLDKRLLSVPVVATTCLSLSHPLFSRQTFDYCLVDEASQINLPQCIGPLRLAHRFVLLGDHSSFAPIVHSPLAREGGFGTSLFRRLCDAHPDVVLHLDRQYRLNQDIMHLVNKIFYSDQMIAGIESVDLCSLKLPTQKPLRALRRENPSQRWLWTALDACRNVVFVDTEGAAFTGSGIGESELEVQMVFQTADMLLRCGLEPTDVGIVSVSCKLEPCLADLARKRSIDFVTVDGSQAWEKKCVIVIASGKWPDFREEDWRLRVALTRAQSKLILFGAASTWRVTPVLSDILRVIEANSWTLRPVDIPAKARQPQVTHSRTQKRSSGDLHEGPVAEGPGRGTKKKARFI